MRPVEVDRFEQRLDRLPRAPVFQQGDSEDDLTVVRSGREGDGAPGALYFST